MSNSQIFCCHLLFQLFLGQMPNLINFDFQACFGRMACSWKWKAAPFGSRPQPIVFKMTNNSLSKERHVSKLSTNNINNIPTTPAGLTFRQHAQRQRQHIKLYVCFFTNFFYFTRLFTDYWHHFKLTLPSTGTQATTTRTTAALGRVFILFRQRNSLLRLKHETWWKPKRNTRLIFLFLYYLILWTNIY